MALFPLNKTLLGQCNIYKMLQESSKEKHVAFHMPGHKAGKWDITELSYSDNLCSPRGVIAKAQEDIAEILGAWESFILTDGSTSGVLSMLYAAKRLGAKNIFLGSDAHKSALNGCKILGLTPLVYTARKVEKIPFPYTMSEMKSNFGELLSEADALFITTPDYYGNVADLQGLRSYCDENGKLLLIDGAHGGHLHFSKEIYAGAYADMWVDGVHKSLPAFNQGAVVSARTEKYAEALCEGVGIFRTTSPSYPIMASVEYAVKYPQNKEIERLARELVASEERLYKNGDWTKLCARFGKHALQAEKALQSAGIYSEFCDGNVIEFYLSPMTTKKEISLLKKTLRTLFIRYPYEEGEEDSPIFCKTPREGEREWVRIEESLGRICAADCGMFPPCTPLLVDGEKIQKEKLRLLVSAANVYGILEGKLLCYKEEV